MSEADLTGVGMASMTVVNGVHALYPGVLINADISIKGYRNILDEKIEFSPDTNLIYGENAQGKTNLIEAIWLLSGGKSFRGTRDREMVNFEGDDFRIEGNIFENGNNINIVVACSKKNTKFATRMAKINGGDFTAPSRIAGSFYCVVFSPVHLNIISGSPQLRRKFIDGCLCQMYPGFIDNYRRYNHVLSVRNTFLRDIKKYDESQKRAMFDTADNALSVYGSEIYRYRKEFCDDLGKMATAYYRDISRNQEKIDIKYNNVASSADEFYQKTLESRERDIITGTTNFGVHKEDVDIRIDSKSARSFASQGQQRSIVVSLKLAESDIIEKISGVGPVILLDDVLSELDFARQDYLLNSIRDKQVFITSCDIDRINRSDSRKFYVENGTVRAEDV